MRKSLSTAIAVTLGLTTLCHPSFSFTIAPTTPPNTDVQRGLTQLELSRNNDNNEESHVVPTTRTTSTADSRRVFFRDTCASLIGGAFAITLLPDEAAAIPGVTVAEFEILVRDSAKSIKSVVFTGPKGEEATVTLADDTQFSITDLIESSFDPRSPLKLVATCRLNNVPTQFSALQDAVRSANPESKKTKVYMNKRIQRAEELNKEKRIRMAEDEVERLAEMESIRQTAAR
eukprot:CAMPEP_0198256960 /NCGR_PEP_ID=MMETSP1447-20131203/6744_1 /TAXON_ID=420782 /ORGANISM="Chaetoceros dichaeta, Strain CCMP1751" /LENGTH=231 /DNA_ID=CAMNT_0043943725 /DNA_START=66 /DNA_END=761 /DNA_ORIENTATION=-